MTLARNVSPLLYTQAFKVLTHCFTAAPIPVKKEDKPAPPNRIQLLDVDVLAKPKASTTILDDRTGKLFIQASTLVTAPDTATDTTKAPKHMVYEYCYWILQKVNKWKWMQDLSAVTAERKIRQVFSNYPIILYAIQGKPMESGDGSF